MTEGFVERPKSARGVISQGEILGFCFEYVEKSSESAQIVKESDVAYAHILGPRWDFAGTE